MAQNEAADGEVLPFGQSDIVNGVGTVRRIVSLEGYTQCAGVREKGVCRQCGYDRGDFVTHTEVHDEAVVVCRACDKKLGNPLE